MGVWIAIIAAIQLVEYIPVQSMDLASTFGQSRPELIGTDGPLNVHSDVKKRSAELSICENRYNLKYAPDNIPKEARYVHRFNNTGSSYDMVQMVWTGVDNGTQVIAMLNSEGETVSDMQYSTDHKSFSNVTVNYEDKPLTDYKISRLQRNPEDSSHVLMIGFIAGDYKSCVSLNSGVVFTCYDIMDSYEPVSEFMFQGSNICAIFKQRLWGMLVTEQILVYSKDFGRTWNRALSGVISAQWHPNKKNIILAQVNELGSSQFIFGQMFNYLKRIDVTNSPVQVNTLPGLGKKVIYGFRYIDKFIHVTAQDPLKDGHKVLMISSDDGKTFNITHLPTAMTSQTISILDSTQSLVFAHISHQTDDTMGSLYTSGSDGLYYSLSLDNHVAEDFYPSLSVQGVYITSRKLNDDSLQTMITHDRGVSWRPLSLHSNCDDLTTCGLQVYGNFMIKRYQSQNRVIGKLPLSQPNAPGIIIVHGTTGDRIKYDPTTHSYSYASTSVFVSGDGGISWTETSLHNVFHIEILDSGSLLIAHEFGKDTVHLKFSVDEGRCWLGLPLQSQTAISVKGMITQPGAQSLSVGLFGLMNLTGLQYWTMIDINFKTIINNQCGESDLQLWQSKPDCYLGVRTVYKRIKLDSWCYLNASQPIKHVSETQCVCSKLRDLQCDYGFHKQDSGDCVEDEKWDGDKVVYCLNGLKYQLKTRGYRKIPGTQCKDTADIKSLTSKYSVPLNTKCDDGDPSSLLTIQDVCEQQSVCTAGNTNSSESHLAGFKIAVALLSLIIIGLILIIVLIVKRGSKFCHKSDNYDTFDEPLSSDFRHDDLIPSTNDANSNERMRISGENSSNGKRYSMLNEEQTRQSDVDLLNL